MAPEIKEHCKESILRKRRTQLRQMMTNTITDYVVGILIIFSILVLALEMSEPDQSFFQLVGWGLNLVFLVELVLRFIASQSRKRFFSQYWVDLISLAPLLFPGLLVLRALRLLRLFRLGPLLLQNNRGLGSAVRQTVKQQITIVAIIFVVVVILALSIHTVEPVGGLELAFWAALYTLVAAEPIGLQPETTLGRVLTLTIMLGGLTVFAVITGTVSAYMAERLRKGWTSKRMAIDDLDGHMIVCGWNRSAKVLLAEFQNVATLRRDIPMVLICEVKPDLDDDLDSDPDLYFIEGDYTKIETLKAAGVERAATAILLADNSLVSRSDQDRDARTVLAGLMIEKLNPVIFTCAELLSRDNETHLRMAGIEEVVIGDEYSATILATSSRVRGVTEIADEIFSNRYGNQIFKRAIKNEWVGMNVLELAHDIKMAHDSMLLAVEKAASSSNDSNEPSAYSRTVTNPPADYEFQKGDSVIFVAKQDPNW